MPLLPQALEARHREQCACHAEQLRAEAQQRSKAEAECRELRQQLAAAQEENLRVETEYEAVRKRTEHMAKALELLEAVLDQTMNQEPGVADAARVSVNNSNDGAPQPPLPRANSAQASRIDGLRQSRQMVQELLHGSRDQAPAGDTWAVKIADKSHAAVRQSLGVVMEDLDDDVACRKHELLNSVQLPIPESDEEGCDLRDV